MSTEELILPIVDNPEIYQSTYEQKGGFDTKTGIYHSLIQLSDHQKIPTQHNLDTATYVLSHFPHPKEAESRVALIDSVTNHQVTYAQLSNSVKSLATGLYHALGVRKGDVILILSPNSTLYPTICLSILSIGAILTTANPLNTELEIAKQARDSGASLGIASPEEAHKLLSLKLPTLFTSLTSDPNTLSVQELIEACDPSEFPRTELTQSDSAAILYSSGTTGPSKGLILTHKNFISIITLLKFCVDATSSQNDVFLCFLPMFHIYGLAFFALGLFCSGLTTVVMPKYDLKAMLNAIETYKINNIPAVPPIILQLVKNNVSGYDLSSIKRVGTGAAPLSKKVAEKFREKFPKVELRQGYGLTESCGAATFFVSDEDAKARLASSGKLFPGFIAKVVDPTSGLALPPCREGELWLKSAVVMKGYLGDDVATKESIDSDGWLKTGDLSYIDEDGFVYIVDRIKELIKHNGYQVAPAELEAFLLSHPQIIDTAVVPVKDEEAGEIPMAYVVKTAGSDLTEDQVIQFVATKVAPYKKVRRVEFISAIPRSAAGKILRKQLVFRSQSQVISKL